MKWSDRRLLDLFGIDHPIIQAPMAGASSAQMTIAVSEAGGLGSIAAAMLTAETLRTELQIVQRGQGDRSTSTSSSMSRRLRMRPAKPAGASDWNPTIASWAWPPTPARAGRCALRSTRRSATCCWK